jgi:hypothetical protein
VHRDGLVAAKRINLLVRLSFDAHCGDVDANRAGQIRAHRADVGQQLWPFGNDDGVNVDDAVSRVADDVDGALEQRDAVRVFPPWIDVGKMLADVAGRRRSENRIGDGMAQHIRIRMSGQAGVMGDVDTADDEPLSALEAMEIVAGADSQ